MLYTIATEIDGKTYYEGYETNYHKFPDMTFTTDENMLHSRTKENAEQCAERREVIGKTTVVPYIEALKACDGVEPKTIYFTQDKAEYMYRVFYREEVNYDYDYGSEYEDHYIKGYEFNGDDATLQWTDNTEEALLFTSDERRKFYDELDRIIRKDMPNYVNVDLDIDYESVTVKGEEWRRVV